MLPRGPRGSGRKGDGPADDEKCGAGGLPLAHRAGRTAHGRVAILADAWCLERWRGLARNKILTKPRKCSLNLRDALAEGALNHKILQLL